MPQHNCHRDLRPRAIFFFYFGHDNYKRDHQIDLKVSIKFKKSVKTWIFDKYTHLISESIKFLVFWDTQNVTVCLSMPRIKSLSPKILINVDWNFDKWKNVDWKSVDYKNLCNILILCLLLIFETKTQKTALVSIRTTDVR